MPYLKDSISILAECANAELQNTRRTLLESEIKSNYFAIDEAEADYSVCAEMVPVVCIGNEYYTEAQFMAPYMRDANIKTMAEALDNIAEANNLPVKSVGLLIESECAISDMIEKACEKESGKVRDAVMNKVDKATKLANSLKDKGYPIKKKKSNKK